VVDRLEARGLMQRGASPEDRRVRLLSLTKAGHQLLAAIEPDMLNAQKRMLAPLSEAKRSEFMRMLRALVSANNELSRAPSEPELRSPGTAASASERPVLREHQQAIGAHGPPSRYSGLMSRLAWRAGNAAPACPCSRSPRAFRAIRAHSS
jgi:hypothetical protein